MVSQPQTIFCLLINKLEFGSDPFEQEFANVLRRKWRCKNHKLPNFRHCKIFGFPTKFANLIRPSLENIEFLSVSRRKLRKGNDILAFREPAERLNRRLLGEDKQKC